MFLKNIQLAKNPKVSAGYVTILMVLVLLTVTGAITATSAFVSIDAMQAEEALRQGNQALLFSDLCLEGGLLQIVRDPNYAGGNFQMPAGECEITVEKNDGIYIVRATGKNDYYERSLAAEAILDLDTSTLKVTNWEEE